MMTKEDRLLLDLIADSEGYADRRELLEACAADSVNPGICRVCKLVNSDMEPDQERGCCEGCGSQRVVAPLVLAGLI